MLEDVKYILILLLFSFSTHAGVTLKVHNHIDQNEITKKDHSLNIHSLMQLRYHYHKKRKNFHFHFVPQYNTATELTGDNQIALREINKNYFSINDLSAWFAFNNLPIDITLGRQNLILNQGNFIGDAEWTNFGRSYDGLLINYIKGLKQLKGFIYYNNDRRNKFSSMGEDYYWGGLHYSTHNDFFEDANTLLTYFNSYDDTNKNKIYTLSEYLTFYIFDFHYELEIGLQKATDTSIQQMFDFMLRKTSGNKSQYVNSFGTFYGSKYLDTLLGRGFNSFGHREIFSGTNLTKASYHFEYIPTEHFSLQGHYNLLLKTSKNANNRNQLNTKYIATNNHKLLGNEFAIIATHKFHHHMKLTYGYNLIKTGKALHENGTSMHHAWINFHLDH